MYIFWIEDNSIIIQLSSDAVLIQFSLITVSKFISYETS